LPQAFRADKSVPVKFSIVTPSFRNSSWLKLCIASVADQGVDCEHIVQDSCSDDGTQDWLAGDKRVRAFIEKDNGMYDAINRGYRRAEGDILAYLNCDEQYLPGALQAVQKYFESHPDIDVALAGTIVTDAQGKYVCHRHSLVPSPWYVWYHFPVLTSSVFFRRSVVQDRKIFFDTQWRASGDFHWILALMKAGVPMGVCDDFTSIFTDTGGNLGMSPGGLREMRQAWAMAPAWSRRLRRVWPLHHRMRRLLAGHFFLKPGSYSIFTSEHPNERVTFEYTKPTAVWWNRLNLAFPKA
jgi:glycosyltransferase involved in cell wall biosynthesis